MFRMTFRVCGYGFLILGMSLLGYAGKKHDGDGLIGGMVGSAGGHFVTSAALIGCDAGYALNEGQCERLLELNGVLECPKGSERVGEDCLVAVPMEAEVRCPPASIDGGDGSCLREEVVVPLVGCAKGWEPLPGGRQCVRRRKSKHNSSCRDGWEVNRNSCIREEIVPARASCPPGYLLEQGGPHGTTCAQIEVAPPAVYCDKGWIAEAGACVRVKKAPKKSAICPAGFVSVGKEGACERRITQDAAVTCPPGTVLLGPQGGKKEGPMCGALERRPVIPRCRKGFVFADNRCVREGQNPERVECPSGFDLGPNGRCHTLTETDAILECPPDAFLSGKECRRSEEIPLRQQCPKGSNLMGGTCLSHDIRAPSMICPQGFKKSKKHQGRCQIEQTIVSKANCPFNSILNGKHCVTRGSAPAEPYCKKGEITPNGCLERVKHQPKLSCPKGFKKHNHNSCAREVTHPPAFLCPPNAILQERNQCLATAISEPSFSCGHNFVLDPSNNCLSVEHTEPVPACPINTVLTNGACYHASFVPQLGGKKKHSNI